MTGHIPGQGDMAGGAAPPAVQPSVSPPSPSPSASAIVSFVLGILAFITCGPCTGIPALIIGLIELRNIRNNASSAEGRPFALVGAILGGINTAFVILGILIYVAMMIFIFTIPGMAD